jgi:flavin reductase (DIM6/NTAB) family NADH-FMN oxidoreductase RutF
MAMFSVDVKTRFADVAAASGRFSINYLADDRDGWAVAFSRGGKSLADISHVITPGRTGVPTLATGTAVVLECSVDQSVPAGDHWIVTGLINHVRAQSDAHLLVYLAGRYGRFTAASAVPQSNQPIAHL